LGLPSPIIKSHLEENWAWSYAKGLPKILRFHFNIYTMAESRDFKFGTQLGFVRAHHKTTPRGILGVAPWAREACTQIFGFSLNISVTAALSS